MCLHAACNSRTRRWKRGEMDHGVPGEEAASKSRQSMGEQSPLVLQRGLSAAPVDLCLPLLLPYHVLLSLSKAGPFDPIHVVVAYLSLSTVHCCQYDCCARRRHHRLQRHAIHRVHPHRRPCSKFSSLAPSIPESGLDFAALPGHSRPISILECLTIQLHSRLACLTRAPS